MTGSTPCERAVARMVGNRRSQNSAPEVPGVEPHVRVPGLEHPAHDRLGDHVARGQVGELVHALHEPVALEVDEEGALAADRLGDQRLLAAGVGAEVHHRRVELDELQVAQRGAGPQRERHAVAGRHRGVGGLGEHLAEAAGGEHDGPAVHRADAVALALADHVQGDAGDAAVLGEQQVDGQRVLDHLDLGRPLDGGDQRPLDLGPGGVAAGVRDPVAVVAALAGQRQLAVGAVVEVGAERDQLVDRLGTLVDQHAHRVEVAGTGAGHEGVVLVLLGGVPGPSAAAMPPCAHWVEPAARTSLVTTRTLSTWSRSRSAAVRPAMPEPMTTTSAVVVQPGSGAVRRPGSRRTASVGASREV